MVVDSRKGVSTFIAVLILITLCVAAGVVIYEYALGHIWGFGASQETTAKGQLKLDSAKINSTLGLLTVYIRNVGTAPVGDFTMYINNVRTATPPAVSPNPLLEGDVAIIGMISNFVEGQTYKITLIAADNTQLTFEVNAYK